MTDLPTDDDDRNPALSALMDELNSDVQEKIKASALNAGELHFALILSDGINYESIHASKDVRVLVNCIADLCGGWVEEGLMGSDHDPDSRAQGVH